MTLEEAYRAGRRLLEEAGNESPAFDASALFEKAFGLSRQQRILHSPEPADDETLREYLSLAGERAAGRPLQYILGTWPFLGLELEVGEGVLVPREETELLVRTAARMLAGTPEPRILDLCSGSGAVALGAAFLLPGARVAAAEKFEAAFSYLEKNVKRTGLAVEPLRLDVLDPASAGRFRGLDCIVSNPPYVESGELPRLQAEVRREPSEALDGGADGLRFYRAIARNWVPALRPGGILAAEVGEGQSHAVAALFAAAGIGNLETQEDFNGIPRIVAGRRTEA